MLAFKTNDTWTRWHGQPLPKNGEGSYQLHSIAEHHLSDDELATFGLFRVEPGVCPEGHQVLSSRLVDQDGRPVEVFTTEPIPAPGPNDYPLTPAQFRAMVDISGYGPDIEAALEAIEDPINKAVARAKYLYSTSYRRDSAILLMLQPIVGIPDVELDALWMIAKDLAA